MRKRYFKSLYWKISALFLILLVLIGAVYIYVTLFTAEMYFQEESQKVSAHIAHSIVEKIDPFTNGEIDRDTLEQFFENALTLNPGIEIYFLDPVGKIIASSTPTESFHLHSVSLEPIEEFIRYNGQRFTLGDDPRGLAEEKVFSAAPMTHDGIIQGYVYVILRGAEYDSASEMLLDSYILRLGARALIVALLSTGIIALIVLGLLMKKLHRMMNAVKAFEQGNFTIRIPIKSSDEVDQLAEAFNSMASTIVGSMEEIKKNDTLRRELVANISHDLKTPLTSIQGYIETLLLKADSLSAEERKKYHERILTGTGRLINLVEQLLELSRLEAKEIALKREPFSVAELVQDVVQKFQPQAERKKIRLRTIFPTELPPVFADIAMIERALQNLIDNALEYTPEIGVVTVELAQNDGNIVLNVSDTGRGISEADLPRVFERFYRAEKSRSRISGGTGLGLAITQRIVQAHGSSITVRSVLNGGTSFSFPLPISTQS